MLDLPTRRRTGRWFAERPELEDLSIESPKHRPSEQMLAAARARANAPRSLTSWVDGRSAARDERARQAPAVITTNSKGTPMLWTETTINGRKCASADYNGKRLYISHISRGVEAWVDGIRLGVFASDEQARKSCIASSAGTKVVAPKAECRPIRPFDGSKFDSRKYVAGEQMNVTIQVDGQPPLPVEPPIKIGDLTITHALIPGMGTPFLDRSTPAEPEQVTVADCQVTDHLTLPGFCSCGTKLGRSGKCPALCTPVTDAAPYKDTGPIGKTHTARLGAPVRW